jgi:hypothetical protein
LGRSQSATDPLALAGSYGIPLRAGRDWNEQEAVRAESLQAAGRPAHRADYIRHGGQGSEDQAGQEPQSVDEREVTLTRAPSRSFRSNDTRHEFTDVRIGCPES